MKRSISTLVILYNFIVVNISCTSVGKIISSGVVYQRHAQADMKTKEFMLMPETRESRIIFRDSCVIEECTQIREVDSLGIHSSTTFIDKYTFIDLKTRSFYQYKILSDTATCIRKYQETDSIKLDCGFPFWNNFKFASEKLNLPFRDTIVHGVKYNLLSIQHTVHYPSDDIVQPQTILAYFLCGKKTYIQFDNETSKKFGCPLVRYDFTTLVDSVMKQPYWISSQLEHSNEKLTAKEIKVMDAWGKYAENYPVK